MNGAKACEFFRAISIKCPAVYGWTLEMARENSHDSRYLARPSHRVIKEIGAYRPMCSVVTTPRTAH